MNYQALKYVPPLKQRFGVFRALIQVWRPKAFRVGTKSFFGFETWKRFDELLPKHL